MNTPLILFSVFALFFSSPLQDDYGYKIQVGTPVYLPNFAHPEFGCNWLGVAGQVFDEAGLPQAGMIVEISGSLEGVSILRYAVSGNSPTFGLSGYEAEIFDHVVASQNAVFIRLLDMVGRQLSERIAFPTYADCSQNLILINLNELIYPYRLYFPLVKKN